MFINICPWLFCLAFQYNTHDTMPEYTSNIAPLVSLGTQIRCRQKGIYTQYKENMLGKN